MGSPFSFAWQWSSGRMAHCTMSPRPTGPHRARHHLRLSQRPRLLQQLLRMSSTSHRAQGQQLVTNSQLHLSRGLRCHLPSSGSSQLLSMVLQVGKGLSRVLTRLSSLEYISHQLSLLHQLHHHHGLSLRASCPWKVIWDRKHPSRV